MHRLHSVCSLISWLFMLSSIASVLWWISLQQNTSSLPVTGDTTCDEKMAIVLRRNRMLVVASQLCMGASALFAVLHFVLWG